MNEMPRLTFSADGTFEMEVKQADVDPGHQVHDNENQNADHHNRNNPRVRQKEEKWRKDLEYWVSKAQNTSHDAEQLSKCLIAMQSYMGKFEELREFAEVFNLLDETMWIELGVVFGAVMKLLPSIITKKKTVDEAITLAAAFLAEVQADPVAAKKDEMARQIVKIVVCYKVKEITESLRNIKNIVYQEVMIYLAQHDDFNNSEHKKLLRDHWPRSWQQLEPTIKKAIELRSEKWMILYCDALFGHMTDAEQKTAEKELQFVTEKWNGSEFKAEKWKDLTHKILFHAIPPNQN